MNQQLAGPRQSGIEEQASLLIETLNTAVVNGRIYWSDHPRVQESIDELQAKLESLTAEIGKPILTITLVEDFLVFQRRPLLSASLSASRLIKVIRELGSGGLSLDREASKANLRALVDVLLKDHKGSEDYAAVNKGLAQVGSTAITFLPPYTEDGARCEAGQTFQDSNFEGLSSGDQQAAGRLYLPVQMYQSVMDLLQNVTVNICQGGKIRFEDVNTQAEMVLRKLADEETTVMNLARHKAYDAFSFGHSVRVATLALNLGRALTGDEDLLIRIGTAALLHDVGKTQVPFDVLHCCGCLTPKQRGQMDMHPELGAKILLDHHDCDSIGVAAAFGHHVGHGQRGYPKTSHDHLISTITEIVKICDVYEALTAVRPYKNAMPPIQAYRVMMSMGDHFDPRLLRKFIEVNGVYPAGQLVELSDGQQARIIRQSSKLTLPVVRPLVDAEGNVLRDEDQELLFLAKLSRIAMPTITKVLEDESLVGSAVI